MISTSIPYFLFLVSTLLIYYVLPAKFRNYLLILAGLVFYAYVKPSYLFIILAVIGVNYYAALRIDKLELRKQKARVLYLAVAVNLAILIYFKYWGFIYDNLLYIAGSELLSSGWLMGKVILPLGLSYYIFQNLGYIIDVYRGTFKPERNVPRFALFTLFFPKLLVGPIERARNLLPQLSQLHHFNPVMFTEGARQIAWGLFKKLVVADRISMYVDAVYANLHHHNSSTFLLATFLYPFQVYADFSGYTDIALGSAKLFGINLMDNFNRPLLAKNVSDFWRRWHISLSSWVNDYVYNPIVFKRRDWGNFGVFFALLLTFVIIGIWHGASWNFVIFGALQACALMYEMLTKSWRKKLSKSIPKVIYNNLSILLTFMFFTFSLIIFRTTTYGSASSIIEVIQRAPGKIYIDQPSTILFICAGILLMLVSDIKDEFNLLKSWFTQRKYWVWQQFAYGILLIYIIIAGVFDGGQFIYFAF